MITMEIDKKRKIQNKGLKFIGFFGIFCSLFFLLGLVLMILRVSLPGWTQSYMKVDVTFPAQSDSISYRGVLNTALEDFIAVHELDTSTKELRKILSKRSANILSYLAEDDQGLYGKKTEVLLPIGDIWDQLNKQLINFDSLQNHRDMGEEMQLLFLSIKSKGLITTRFNTEVLTNADSRFPEIAGLYGALVGSFYAILICFLISFPLSIATSIYLEEIIPRSKLSNIIDININNLAAVPSVVFGLLGLAFFIGVMNFPRSSPLVGGLVLALMSLPSMVIAARESLRRVPHSLREASLSLGASKQQTVFHHILPNALPGIMTGTIIALAQALGETAPLLLIGMNAFVAADPGSIIEPATSLPTQIYIWSDSPERGFVSRTGIAIVVLLMFLLLMNGISIYLRNKWSQRKFQ